MSHFIDICLLCLNRKSDLKLVKSKDTDDIINKLKYCLPENDVISSIPERICGECENSLNNFYEFKQKCLQNMITYQKFAEQLTTTDSSYKYLSVRITNDSGNNSELPTENSVKIDVKTEQKCLQDIYESQIETNIEIINSEESIIKKESDALVMNDEQEFVLCEIKQENPESDNSCNKNENIIVGNVQAPDNFVSFPIKNENICEQEFEQYDCLETCPDEKLHKCQNCNGEFSNNEDLQQHLKIHASTLNNNNRFTCDFCNKSFKLSQYLRKHKLMHTAEKPFTCEICSESFLWPSHLKYHKLVHTGEKPFTCEVCNKSFQTSRYLKYHKVKHTSEKTFTCEVCNESFKQSGDLVVHKHVHTGKKIYTCDVCKKIFTKSSNLKRHELIHTGVKSYTCEVCSRPFKQSADLKRHKLVHTGERLFFCEVCKKSFKRLYRLTQHKLIHTRKNT